MADYRLNSGTLVELAGMIADEFQAMTGQSSRIIDICNLALSNIGESARVTSIDPPDGSAQATFCATFYPMARDTLLERHAWEFTKRHVELVARVGGTDRDDWSYAYQHPADCQKLLWIIDATLWTRQTTGFQPNDAYRQRDSWGESAKFPNVYTVENDSLGVRTIYTNTENAVLHYCSRDHDPDRFSDLFVRALGYELAGMLAGALVRGEEGSKKKADMLEFARVFEDTAREQDSRSSRRHEPDRGVTWRRGW